MSDNLTALETMLPRLADGLLVTLQLTVGGATLAFVIAVALGLAARHHSTVVRGPARVLIEFFRGTSLLVQLFWLFYVMPQLGLTLSSLFTGVLALGLNYGAYGAEVVRGAINSVPKGQWEAAVALSLSPVRRMRKVIWPQAWAIMIPSLSNLAVMLLKGTAVAYVILMHDITFVTEQLRQRTNDTFFSYGVGMVMYFAIAYLIVLLANALEIRAKNRLGTGPPLRDVFRPRDPAAHAGEVT
ncbi:ectoine/hydroxyectoine ABC transporter permease subunit EhuC [Quadrisphaera sp. GCM10027208]|uniref:ectoine/hydroxyectoine ABC transporter permease subunit EhuC n=1 Tax=Quadrisphaera sp. GCM10027208 TaxID=3273423 RepID=UPI0036147321